MPHSFQRRKHANFIERCGGLGHQVDADTQLLDRRRLQYFTADAVLVQEKRGGQSSDTRTDDDRFHVPSVVIALATGRVGTSSLGRPSDTMRGELTVGKSRWL